MNEVTTRSILMYHNGYCSQRTPALPLIWTIDEGIEIIEKILQKEVLCRHDVENINRAYETIDFLERRIETIPDRNSTQLLQMLIQRIARAYQSSRDIISIYHLRAFADPDLKARFQRRFQDFSKKELNPREIAEYIPCCQSVKDFDIDIVHCIPSIQKEEALRSLTTSEVDLKKTERRRTELDRLRQEYPGQYPHYFDELLKQCCYEKFDYLLSVHKTLVKRRKKLENYEHLLKMVDDRKEKLQRLRTDDPQKYPDYFDEFLQNGYVYLYDHLIEMRGLRVRNDRLQEVGEKPFSLLSHVILDTRESIIRKVESCIPPHSQNVLFLLGGSGAGKSTTLCYLRGDEIESKGDKFDSKSSNRIIGHEGDTSCTFLPTTELVNDLVIVDFPGFDDSNGQLISLGMELALKALIQKYRPKILVVEAITNDAGRYASVAQLGLRLTRLLDNKRDCVLGITKYTQESNFKDIAHIEETQRKEGDVPSEEEKNLMEDIGYLSRRDPTNPEVIEFKTRLEQLRAKKSQQGFRPLPDTPEKAKHREALEEKENTMLKQIGLETVMRFADLKDRELLLRYLKELSNKGEVRTNPIQTLDATDQEFLNERFENQLLIEIEKQQDYATELEINSFQEKVLNSSLLKTILSESHPEIGDFLHLPEMDPNVVKKYDLQIVHSCIKKCMKTVIRELDLTYFKALIGNAPSRASKNKSRKSKEELQKSLTALMRYVIGRAGEKTDGITQADIEKAWTSIQEGHKQAAFSAVEQDYMLPAWAKIGLSIPLGIPLIVRSLLKRHAEASKQRELIEVVIHEACEGLDQMLNVLTGLKEIEKIITKKDLIEEVFASLPLAIDSEKDLEDSIQCKLSAVKKTYDNDEYEIWASRVEALKRKYFSRLMPSVQTTNYLALVSQLLDDTIICVQSTKPLEQFIGEMGIPSTQNALLMGSDTILLKGKMNATVFTIEVNRRAKEKIATVDEKLSRDQELLERIDQFKAEMDMRRPLFRTMLADIIMQLFSR